MQPAAVDCSCLYVEIVVEETWINSFLSGQNLVIPATQKYNLENPRVELELARLILQADIREKKNSAIRLTCLPVWDVEQQKVQMQGIEIKLLSRNILLQSAGWFAKTFMSSKIVKKIEEAANQFYVDQIQKAIHEGLRIPIQKNGSASARIKSITLQEIAFVHQTIVVKAMLEGYWKLEIK
jgi:hypothetical protein